MSSKDFRRNTVAASSAFVRTNAYFATQNACWENPKPFQICTLLVQARKETYSYQMIVKTMKYLLIHTKDAGMIIFTLLKKSGRISLVSV